MNKNVLRVKNEIKKNIALNDISTFFRFIFVLPVCHGFHQRLMASSTKFSTSIRSKVVKHALDICVATNFFMGFSRNIFWVEIFLSYWIFFSIYREAASNQSLSAWKCFGKKLTSSSFSSLIKVGKQEISFRNLQNCFIYSQSAWAHNEKLFDKQKKNLKKNIFRQKFLFFMKLAEQMTQEILLTMESIWMRTEST